MKGRVILKGGMDTQPDGSIDTAFRINSNPTMATEMRRFLRLFVGDVPVDMEVSEDCTDLRFRRNDHRSVGYRSHREITVTYETPMRPLGKAVPVRMDLEGEGGYQMTLELKACRGPLADAMLNLFRAEDLRVMPSDDGRMICIWDPSLDSDFVEAGE